MKNKNETKFCKHCQTEIPRKAKVCPNCQKKQSGIVKWIVIAIVIIAIIGAASRGGNESQKTSNTANTQQNSSAEVDKTEETKEESKEEPKEEITYTTYTVSQMMNDLETNALKAEKTYKNQYVEITGRLGTVDSSGKYIALYPEDNEWALIGVQCYIKTDEQKEKVAEMATGDIITLKGKITSVGEVIGYSLDIDVIN